jgi:hypothetical protein
MAMMAVLAFMLAVVLLCLVTCSADAPRDGCVAAIVVAMMTTVALRGTRIAQPTCVASHAPLMLFVLAMMFLSLIAAGANCACDSCVAAKVVVTLVAAKVVCVTLRVQRGRIVTQTRIRCCLAAIRAGYVVATAETVQSTLVGLGLTLRAEAVRSCAAGGVVVVAMWM